MSEREHRVTEQAVLDVFDEVAESGEPLATSEVAEALDCSHRVAYDRLETLTDRSAISSKIIGARARAWWRPPAEESTQTTATNTGPSHSHGNRSGETPLSLEQIFDTCPVSIVVVESSGELSFANGRAADLLDLERDETTGAVLDQPDWTIYDSEGTPFPDGEHPASCAFETGDPVFGFEHWVETATGTERWLRGNAAPVATCDGTVEQVVVGFIDATALKEREDKLTSEERRRLTLSSETLFEPFLSVATGTFQVDVEDVVTLQDETVVTYLTVTGLTAKAVIRIFEDEFDATDVRLIRSTGEECTVEVQLTPPTVTLAFKNHGGEVVSIGRHEPGADPEFVAELPGDVDPRDAVQSARRVYPDMKLESQELRYSPRLLYDIVEDELTERQFAVLQMAYHGGYFEMPRKSDGDELADRLEITRQTFNQHLRRAEKTVFEQLFEASGKAGR